MPIASVLSRLLILLLVSSCVMTSVAFGQMLPPGERFSLVLSGDPFKWEDDLNELGQRGWDAVMAQQPAMSGLILHFVIFVRTPAIKSVDYKVVVAEFPTESDPLTLARARSLLETQANAYGRSGWTLLQALTGQQSGAKSYIALILKKPLV